MNNKLFWFGIDGEISNGKTTLVKKMMNFFLDKSDVNVCGFYQPCLFENNQRKQYLLELLNNERKIHEFILANRDESKKHGNMKCPYEFNQTAFENVKIAAKNAKCLMSSEKPVIVFMDEIGYIETQKGGHYEALVNYIESVRDAKKICFVFTYTDIRKECVEKLLNGIFDTPKTDLKINIKSSDEDIYKFCDDVYEFLIK